MPATAIEIQGTLQEDGTLLLDHQPNLPPGRVRVTVQTVPDLRKTEIWQFLEQIHAEQRASGFVPRSVEEIDAEIADGRDDDERSRLIEQIQEECRRQREGQQPSEAT